MNLFETINADVKMLESELGNPTFIFDSMEYGCLPTDCNTSSNGSTIGWMKDSNLSLTVRLDQFGTDNRPKEKQHITYMGYDCLINKITKPVHQQFWVLECSMPDVKKL